MTAGPNVTKLGSLHGSLIVTNSPGKEVYADCEPAVPVIITAYGLSCAILKSWSLKKVKVSPLIVIASVAAGGFTKNV